MPSSVRAKQIHNMVWPREIVQPYMAKVKEGGGTRLYEAIKETISDLRATTTSETVKVVIALTDGDDTYQGIQGMGSQSATEEEGEWGCSC